MGEGIVMGRFSVDRVLGTKILLPYYSKGMIRLLTERDIYTKRRYIRESFPIDSRDKEPV